MTCPICGDKKFVLVVTEKYPDGAYTPCRCFLEDNRRKALEKLLIESGMTLQQLSRWRFETFDIDKVRTNTKGRMAIAEALEDLKVYAENPVGWRVLQGLPGTAKTHLAYAVASRRAELSRPVFVSNVPDLLDMLRHGFEDASYDSRMKTLRETELLVMDDLGVENATPFALEKLYQIIDYRYRNVLPLIVTTNRNLHNDTDIPARIVSRLLDVDLTKVWTFAAHDYRRREK